MANHSHFMGMQPRTTGQVFPPGRLPLMPMQFRPGAAPPPPQPFGTQQYRQYPLVEPFPPQQQTQRPGLVGPPRQNLDFQPSRPVMFAQAQPQPQIPNSYTQPYTPNVPRCTGGGQSWFPSGNQNMQVDRPPPQQRMERGVMGQTCFSTGNLGINPVTSLELTAATRNQTLQSVPPSRQSEERDCGRNNSEKSLKPNPTKKPRSYWREHTTREGKKYYFNKRIWVSSWEKPLELMTPNERADASAGWQEATAPSGIKYYYNKVANFSKWAMPDEVKLARDQANLSSSEGRSTAENVNTFNANNEYFTVQHMARSPVPIAIVAEPDTVENFELPRMQGEVVDVTSVAAGLHSTLDSASPVLIVTTDAVATPARTPDTAVPMEAAPPSANAAHNTEFVEHQKRQEAEENRAKQKKSHEDFKKMLEESNDLTSCTRWSKVVSMFENDERFQAVEVVKDREDFFADYMEELEKKEHKHNLLEYWEFLKSCDFIKASSQWRKVQNRLEADERCSRLEKVERLELFQEYVHDLEKEEEEQIKLRMEEQRKTERKNRDEFRKLMAEHVANGIITSKTVWRDYCVKVQDALAYLGVYSNTLGSTAKGLFDDVVEDLDKQYAEEKEQIEDAVKSEKISLSTNWTIEDFKTAIAKQISSKPINDINLKLVFDELLEKATEEEEKEAKKRKLLTDDVYEFLYSSKDVSASSKWEECKRHVEEKFIGEESFFQDIFNKLIAELNEKEKEKERKRKDAKAKKEKEKNDREKNEKVRNDRRKKEKGRKNRHRRDRVKRELRDTEKHVKDGTDRTGSHSMDENRISRDKAKQKKDGVDSCGIVGVDENRQSEGKGKRKKDGTGSRSVDENRRSRDKGKRKKEGTDIDGTGSRGVDENRKSRDKRMLKKDSSRGVDENRRLRDKGKRKRDGADCGGTSSRRDKGKRKKEGTESRGTGSYNLDENRRSRDGDKDRKHRKRRRISLDTVSLTSKDDRSKSHRHIVDLKKSKKVKRQFVTSEMDTGSRWKKQRR